MPIQIPLAPSSSHQSATLRRVRRDQSRQGFAMPVLILGDAIVATGALAFAFFLRFEVFYLPAEHLPLPEFARYTSHCLFGAALYVVMAAGAGLYDLDASLRIHRTTERILRTAVLWFFVFLGLSLFLGIQPPVSRLFALAALVCLLASQGAWRLLAGQALPTLVSSRTRDRVLIVGTGSAANAMASRLSASGVAAPEVLGHVGSGQSMDGPPGDHPVLGRLDDFEMLCARLDPDQVCVADGNLTQSEILGIARICERRFIQFYLAASSFEVFTSCLRLRRIAGIPVMGVAELPANRPLNRVLKRVFDVVGAGIGLVLSAPLMLVLAWFIKRESPGPVFYRQIRVGQNGKSFTILKLRSMRIDAEAASGARWCEENDPRRTRIGEFMRRTNLDELPQFWNVLVGEMSLVGPRPERPELIPRFLNQIPYYQSRHSVKPGMTGWAQVNGLRGNTDLGERIRFDLHYIEKWTLGWDLSIAVQTFFRSRNAY